MKRIINFRENLDIHGLKEMEKEYSEMEKQQTKILLSKANSGEFNSHYKTLEEIKEFKEIIEVTIDEINNLLLN